MADVDGCGGGGGNEAYSTERAREDTAILEGQDRRREICSILDRHL